MQYHLDEGEQHRDTSTDQRSQRKDSMKCPVVQDWSLGD
jgi:hypothetical protein